MGTPIKSKAIYTGRNYDVGAFRDDHYVRCSRCGWICQMDRDIHSNDGGYEGWGTTFVAVTSTSGGSGFGPNSPFNTIQTPGLSGQLMYSTSTNSTDILVNSYGTFSFQFSTGNVNVILLNGVSTGSSGVMLLLFNSNIYMIDNNSNWHQYTGSWTPVASDPRTTADINENDPDWDSGQSWDSGEPWDIDPYVETTMDAVVGAGCPQCGTLLYTR